MILKNIFIVVVAFIIDKIVGDPLNLPHPVRWIGSLISRLDKLLNVGSNRQLKGLLMLITVLTLSVGTVLILLLIAYKIHPFIGITVEIIIIATTIAQKSLKEAALQVYDPLVKGDLQTARLKLSYIVGRDTEKLSTEEITRATVETVAENVCDGVTAPLFWAFIGGAPLAIAYRVINTCDSMVGYKNDQYLLFGKSSAKADDFANFIPSRLTGILMMVTMKPYEISLGAAFKLLFTHAKRHLSPNSGWGEAPTALLLGVQLGGVSTYRGVLSERPKIGERRLTLQEDHIKKSIIIMERTSLLFLIIMSCGGIVIEMACSWS